VLLSSRGGNREIAVVSHGYGDGKGANEWIRLLQKQVLMMKCPYCSGETSKVIDKRDAPDVGHIRRRRECLAPKCGKRFTTYERVENLDLSVVKKDGRRERFDRGKLLGGLLKACEKRPIPRENIEAVVDDIEASLRAYPSTEIDSKVIGEMVVKKLKKLDKVAYIRFASVYREFDDLNSFKNELEKLIRK
jgi:transcriptional repressor NrdR